MTAAPDEPPTVFSVRGSRGGKIELEDGAALRRLAMRWSYIVRYRRRWKNQKRATESLQQKIGEELHALGVKTAAVRKLAASPLIEVRVPFAQEDIGWSGRILPWEFILSKVTKPYRDRPLTIVRHLDLGDRPEPIAPKRYGIVKTVPTALEDRFAFDLQREFVRSSLYGVTAAPLLENPSESDLRAWLDDEAPDIVHIAGIDNHQAAEILGRTLDREQKDVDGLPLRDDADDVDFVPAKRTAEILVSASSASRLVACNVSNSAARVAALCVAGGARSAIGFQDTFDERLAEVFFSDFYDAWRTSEWNELVAFSEAWAKLRRRGHRDYGGTGIVLWSATSLLQGVKSFDEGRRKLDVVVTASASTEDVDAAPTSTEVAAAVQFEIKPYATFNYSMLHNNRDLFDSFDILYTGRGSPTVEVEATLHVGPDTIPWRSTVKLAKHERISLRGRIRVPLTSELFRSVRESMRTSLHVEIRYEDRVLLRDTHWVSLLAADEWRDSAEDRMWLPSFVLPRDPAVVKIIDFAQRYLVALADYAAAGFDGYQSVDPDSRDFTSVHHQVQAIWWALVHDFALDYINPPPTYTGLSQRLRSPSQVVNDGRGTCIDLTLLFAACLEYVGIYPVVFLFEGHACPGYWADDAAYTSDFLGLESIATAAMTDTPGSVDTGGVRGNHEPFVLDRDAFDEIRQRMFDGTLVPVELVAVTERSGFSDAVELGRGNLARKVDFDVMFDVFLARREPSKVTPLPLLGEA